MLITFNKMVDDSMREICGVDDSHENDASLQHTATATATNINKQQQQQQHLHQHTSKPRRVFSWRILHAFR